MADPPSEESYRLSERQILTEFTPKLKQAKGPNREAEVKEGEEEN
jgi:hypothetical protein